MTTADELSRLLDAERRVRPPEGGLEQGLSRLLGDFAQRVAPLPIATGSLKLGLSLVSKWLLVGFVVGLAGAGAVSQIGATNAAAAPSAVPHSHGLAVSLAAGSAAPAVAPPVEPFNTVAEVAAPPVGRPTPLPLPLPLPLPSVADATTFDEELRLVTAAKSELSRGRAQFAAAWLTEHAQRFPSGVFTLDREALRVLVACSKQKQLGLAQAFAANHPKSPMVPRLLRACGGGDAKAPSSVDFSQSDK